MDFNDAVDPSNRFQCCQVPVFVRNFTEIRPVIRSTEMQWSIPQIWKKQNQEKFQSQTSFSFKLTTCHARGSIGESTCCWPIIGYSIILPETRYYFSCLTPCQKLESISVVCVWFSTIMSEPPSSPRPKKKKAKRAGHFLSSVVYRLEFRRQKKGPAFCLLLSLLHWPHHWPWRHNNPTRKMHLWVFEFFELCFSIQNQILLVPSSSSSHHHLLLRHHVYNCMCVQACVISDVCSNVLYPLSVG